MNDKIPDSAQVKETLAEILSEMGKGRDPDDLSWLGKILEGIFRFFEGLGSFFWVILIAAAAVVIGLIIYRIMSGSGTNTGSVLFPFNPEDEEITISIPSSEYYDLAEKQAGISDYSQGVVFLYRASISSLVEQGVIIEDTGATNREIRRMIRLNEKYLDTFSVLAEYSEHVLFNDEVLGETDYLNAKDTYKRGFSPR